MGLIAATLVLGVVADAALSAERMVYQHSGGIWASDAPLGGNATLITNGSGSPSYPPEKPSLSPDGQRIAYDDGCTAFSCGGTWGDIYVTSINGGRGSLVVNSGGVPQGDVQWIVGGRGLVYARADGSDGGWDIYTVGLDGSGTKRVIGWPGSQVRPEYSPGGTRLAFTSYTTPSGSTLSDGPHVYVTDAAGSGPVDIGPGWAPTFSPTSDRLAFRRNGEIFTSDVTGANAKQLTRSKTGSDEPDWSPDGSVIAFNRGPISSDSLWTVDPSGRNEQAVSWGAHVSFRTSSPATDEDLAVQYAPELRYDLYEDYYADYPSVLTDMYVTTPPERARSNRLVDGGGNTLAYSAPPVLVGDQQLSLGFLDSPLYTNAGLNSSTDHSIDAYGDSEADYVPDAQMMHTDPTRGDMVLSRTVTDAGMTWVQYWFFYYADWVPGAAQVGDHEGDWEMMQIGLTGGVPQVATFAAHGDAEAISCPWTSVETTPYGGLLAPVVYPARGTHASYPHAGDYTRDLGPVTLTDHASGSYGVRPQVVVGALNPGAGWVKWPGFWGNSHPGGIEVGEQPSPHGPMFQGPKWSSPATFNANARPCSSVAPAASAARSTSASGARARHYGPDAAVPVPEIHAQRRGRRATVRYLFDGKMRSRPGQVLISIAPADRRRVEDGQQPRTFGYRVRGRQGRQTQSLPLGRGPFIVRAAALTRDGRQGATATIRLR